MDAAKRPLRFGIMCGSSGLNEFARACIGHLTRDNLAEPVLLIVDPSTPKVSSAKTKLARAVRLNGNLWYLQSRLFPLEAIPAYRSTPLEQCFPAVQRIVAEPQLKGKWSQYFKPQDIAVIRAANLDFILKFGYGIVRGEALLTAKYGVWSYHHDDEERYRGGPPGFWELALGDPVNGVLLQKLNDRLDGGVVLKKIWAGVDTRSYRANLQNILESSAHMVRWVVLDILNGNSAYLSNPPSPTNAPIFVAPTDFQMLRFWMRLAGNWLRAKAANQRVDQWNVGLVKAEPARFLDPSFRPDIEWATHRSAGQMVADPFLVPDTPDPRILVEEFDFHAEKGRISEIRRGPDGKLSQIRPVIDEPVHMSYPYPFVYRGQSYCIPETGQARQIRLYRLDNGQWKLDRILIDNIDAVDATVFEANGSWWLMYSGAAAMPSWSLYLCQADSPFGPWTPHPGNPVRTDIRGSRPAGSPFTWQGQLYRPAQNGSKSYGGGLTLNRIDSLSLEEFREVAVRRIEPGEFCGWYRDGIHTLQGSSPACWSVIDAKRHTWPFGVLVKRFVLRKLLGRRDPARFPA